jgi:hypothetical protein
MRVFHSALVFAPGTDAGFRFQVKQRANAADQVDLTSERFARQESKLAITKQKSRGVLPKPRGFQ